MNRDQFDRLQANYRQSWDRYNREVESLDRGLRGTARENRLRELRGNFYDEFNQNTRDVFNNQQRNRFDQLYLQYQGVNAFDDPNYRQRLNLNPQQQQRLQNVQQQWNRGLQELRDNNANQEERQRRFAELRQRTNNDFLEILDEDQRQAYRDAGGEQFDFTDDYYFNDSTRERNPRTQADE